MKQTLVAYHSRSGHTRRVARALAERLDADLDEIVVDTPRQGPLGYALCALEALTQCTPDLRRAAHDPSRYSLVVIGTPVWFWSLSSPVLAWARRHTFSQSKLAFFCTMGGSGAERAFAQLEGACGKASQARLALTEPQLTKDIAPALSRFVADLKHEPAKKEAARKAAPPRRQRPVARAAR
jgi:flavodoxin